jgi:hypothetical protein
MDNTTKKAIFYILKEAHDAGAGVDFEHLLINDSDFLIEEIEDTLDIVFRIHTRSFVAKVERIVVLENEDDEKGTWYKRYNIEEESSRYSRYGNPKKNVGLNTITKFVHKNIEKIVV